MQVDNDVTPDFNFIKKYLSHHLMNLLGVHLIIFKLVLLELHRVVIVFTIEDDQEYIDAYPALSSLS